MAIWIINFVFSLLVVAAAANEAALRFKLRAPENVDFAENILNLLEGTRFQIKCMFQGGGAPEAIPKWSKNGDANFLESATDLEIHELRRDHTGVYSCRGAKYIRNLTLNVLSPVNQTTLTGPFMVTKKSSVQWTCDADSNPPPRYWWTFDHRSDSTKISSDATLTMHNIDREDIWLYCFAQNEMNPTFDRPVLSSTFSSYRHVTVQGPATIKDLPENYTTYVGSTIDISCDVDGLPTPRVWWTKESDAKFSGNGNRLIKVKVQLAYAGIYVCNAKNTIRLDDGTEKEIETFRRVAVTVQDIPQETMTNNTAIVILAVTGWTVAVLLVAVAVLFCIRRKYKESHYSEVKERLIELPTISRPGFTFRRKSDSPYTNDGTMTTKMAVACQTSFVSRTCETSPDQTLRKLPGSLYDTDGLGMYDKI